MSSIKGYFFLLIHLMVFSNGSSEQAAGGAEVLGEEVWAGRVSLLVARLIEQHYTGCHVVLLTTAPHSPTGCAIRR